MSLSVWHVVTGVRCIYGRMRSCACCTEALVKDGQVERSAMLFGRMCKSPIADRAIQHEDSQVLIVRHSLPGRS